MRSEHIAVVGAGLMGHGIAQVFAAKGNEVALTDTDPGVLAGAVAKIRSNLIFLASHGIGVEEDVESTVRNIRSTSDLGDAVRGARFVIEAVPESAALKQGLLQAIEGFVAPATILATNTSVISITEIAAKVKKRERIVGTHFWNPPCLIPLVEVVPGKYTSSEVVDYAFDLLKTAGQHPVKIRKDVPGCVGNRLQHALWREAMSIVEQGIADPATVDDVVKNSFGIRMPVLAPLETADMVGLDLTLQIHDYILRHIDRSQVSSPVLRDKVQKGELGFKAGRGFYEWDKESMGQCRKRLAEHLIGRNRENMDG